MVKRDSPSGAVIAYAALAVCFALAGVVVWWLT